MHLTLLHLPNELIDTIVTYLDPNDLERTSRTCRILRVICLDDKLWRQHIQEIVPYTLPSHVPAREGVARLLDQKLIRPGNVTSWLDVWRGFHHFWFILKRRFWISDQSPGGGLVIALFDLNSLQIKGYRLLAQSSFEGPPTVTFSERDAHVAITSFDPVLTRQRENFTITHPGPWTEPCSFPLGSVSYGHSDGNLPPEVRCTDRPGGNYYVHKLLLAKDLPSAAIGRNTSVWPPQSLPSANRVRNSNLGPLVGMTRGYQPDYESKGYRPENFSERSLDAFRMSNPPRSISIGYGRYVGVTPSGGETFAAIHPSVLEPTAQKPLQGIWIGDYNGHGNEFVLFLQPELTDTSYFTMPEHAQEVLDELDEQYEYDAEADPIPASPYKGRLVGIKLSGDRNVPRSENTFIVPNLGDVIRIAHERPFRNGQVVRALAHTAHDMFTNGQYKVVRL